MWFVQLAKLQMWQPGQHGVVPYSAHSCGYSSSCWLDSPDSAWLHDCLHNMLNIILQALLHLRLDNWLFNALRLLHNSTSFLMFWCGDFCVENEKINYFTPCTYVQGKYESDLWLVPLYRWYSLNLPVQYIFSRIYTLYRQSKVGGTCLLLDPLMKNYGLQACAIYLSIYPSKWEIGKIMNSGHYSLQHWI